MAKEARKQAGLNMRATLHDDLAKLAKDNGQTTTVMVRFGMGCQLMAALGS